MGISNSKKLLSNNYFLVPHIGHLYTAAIADAIARFNSMQGHITLLNTGTDEHGNKVEQAAKYLKLPTDQYCHVISEKFREMCHRFGIGYTNFVRTTDPNHQITVQNFWVIILFTLIKVFTAVIYLFQNF